MCKMTEMMIKDRKIKVAEHKEKYMANIVDAASKCDFIDRIVLFGSSTEERCRKNSDIDLAVFGDKSEMQALTSKKYERFARQLYGFDDHNQAYDLLYYKTGTHSNDEIMKDINRGELLYVQKTPQ